MTYFPPHIARPSALVGPMVRFRGQPVNVARSAPTSTLDPRHDACTDHHLACDCREAEMAENIHEYRAEYRLNRDTLAAILDGHATRVHVRRHDHNRYDHRPDLECQCTGCQFARKAHLVPPANSRHID